VHVLLIHQLFVLGREAGGTRHVELARHLARAGDRVTVIASPVSYLTGRAHSSGERSGEVEPGITLLRAWTLRPRRQSFPGRVLSFVSFAASSTLAALRTPGVDVVWGTSPPLFQALGALLVARLRGVPFVLEIRDLWPDFAVQLGVLRSRWMIAAARFAERLVCRQADRVIVNSPGFVPHVVALGVDPARVALVPNGVEVDDFDPTERGGAFRRELGIGAGDVLVVYTGAQGEPNDLGVVLEAAARLKDRADIHFALVGDGRAGEALQDRAKELGLARVTFVPPRPKAAMPEVLAAADVCLAILKPIPLFDTTYPNKVFDYMAAGRPTVLAIDGVIRRVVEDAGGGVFVPPGDGAALARAVVRYADDAGLRARHGKAARRAVERSFRREQHARRLRQVLRQAGVGSGPAARSVGGVD